MVRDDGRIKVLDFGLARRASERRSRTPEVDNGIPKIHHDTTFTETGQSTLTAVGTLLGTPQYMAPEQIRSEPIDERSDQFAWGVVAYELLTGELPWKGVGIHVMARILTDPAAPIRSLNPDVPEGAAAVVMRALARVPDDRFPSMDALISALEPHADPASRSDPRSIRHRSLTPRAVVAARPPVTPAPPAEHHKTQRSADYAALRRAAPAPRSTAPPRSRRRAPRVEVVDAPPDPLRARGLAVAVGVIALCLGSVVAWRATRGRAGVAPPPVAAAGERLRRACPRPRRSPTCPIRARRARRRWRPTGPASRSCASGARATPWRGRRRTTPRGRRRTARARSTPPSPPSTTRGARTCARRPSCAPSSASGTSSSSTPSSRCCSASPPTGPRPSAASTARPCAAPATPSSGTSAAS